MRTSRLTALLVAAAIATTTGCGGDDKKKDEPAKAGEATTGASAPAATTPAPTATTAPLPEGSKNDPEPGRTVQAYFSALAKRDGEKACSFMGPAMKSAAVKFATVQLKDRKISTCPAALLKIIKPATDADLAKIANVQIISSTVVDTAATVKVQNASRDATLTKSGTAWLITGGIFEE